MSLQLSFGNPLMIILLKLRDYSIFFQFIFCGGAGHYPIELQVQCGCFRPQGRGSQQN